ncbi:MAG: Cache 3/Cache 2 fusion domain-containing protein, partial [Tepidimonas sp.]|nr:Cache 3/Cache 2 fusion domain-containing protein [Tepidimonas sp.]
MGRARSAAAAGDPGASTLAWHQRLGARLALILGVASALLVLGLAAFSLSMYRDERAARLDELAERAATLAVVAEQVDESGKRNVQRLYAEFEQLVPSVALSWIERSGQRQLALYGQPLEGDTTQVDLFAQRSGGVATVFQREGQDFRRITTSVTKEDGSRAVGTLLGTQHPAYAAVMAGQRYVGRAVLFGRSYMTVYQPVKLGGEVAAILFVGYDLNTEMGVMAKLFKAVNSGTVMAAA